MTIKKFRVAGLWLDRTDVVTLGGLVALTLLAAVFHRYLASPVTLFAADGLFIAVYVVSVAALPRLRRPWPRFAVRTAVVQMSFLQIYKAANELQLVFFGWQDDRVLALERAVLGGQPLIAIQKLYSPALNEWMFFVYVFYIVIYPALGAVIFFKRGEAANEDYLFRLGLVNLVCAAGFMLFPVASPMYWPKVRELLTEPLTAGVFGSIAEFIRAHVHQPGGSIPSPHCAVATVMWLSAYKYARRTFFWLAPIVLSLYVSTVYGRFHYLTDVVVGIAAGIAVTLIVSAGRRTSDPRIPPAPGERP